MRRRANSEREQRSHRVLGSDPNRLRQRNVSPQPRVRHETVKSNLRGRRSTPLSLPVRVAGLAGFFLVALAAGMATSPPVSRATAQWWNDAPARLRSIAVLGHQELEAAQVASATGLARGAFLVNVNAGAIADQLAGHDWIETAKVVSLPSGQLLVRIQERQARATLDAGKQAPAMWVDAAGIPFAQANGEASPTLLRLVTARAFPAGEPQPLLANAIALGAHLAGRPELRGLAAEISPPEPGDPQGWILRTAGGELEVVLGTWEPSDAPPGQALQDLEPRLTHLERLLATDLAEGEITGRIDLRFKDQAIWVAHASSGRKPHARD